jgi:hypothetical protein
MSCKALSEREEESRRPEEARGGYPVTHYVDAYHHHIIISYCPVPVTNQAVSLKVGLGVPAPQNGSLP